MTLKSLHGFLGIGNNLEMSSDSPLFFLSFFHKFWWFCEFRDEFYLASSLLSRPKDSKVRFVSWLASSCLFFSLVSSTSHFVLSSCLHHPLRVTSFPIYLLQINNFQFRFPFQIKKYIFLKLIERFHTLLTQSVSNPSLSLILFLHLKNPLLLYIFGLIGFKDPN